MAAPVVSAAPQGALERIKTLAPGVALSFAVAVVSIMIRNATGIAALNPVVVALILGIGFHSVWGTPAILKPGIAFAVRPVLRAAIVLLGLQVTLGMLWSLGPAALMLAVVVVAATLPFTIWLGQLMGVDKPLAQLIGTGTAICGASAIVAANQVSRAREEDVTYALAVITLCGTAAMILFPYMAGPLGLDAQDYGIWAGGAIHEVVQAVGAAAAGGPVSSQTGTVMKLARVFMLAPAVLALGWWVARQSGGEAHGVKAPVPVFAFGFLALVLLGSTGLVPQVAVDASRFLVPLMLAASVAALGLQTNLKALKARGVAPLALGVLSSLFIAALAYVGVLIIG
ncbi:putative sulfate exporter family transporter [Rhodovarius crocodyli]|uniref:Putative sulfate exporter family transporter n=1 Tax=Rhodovarius crocodyli TaxID=1979269 RepID=A0A437MEH9_9PROT|nr:putative sulfate exporter family transporter [Rhodovarius crocodyli]RVT96026.1 putative sulfate exporter family transporter [Rhodovarius crocodyli]